MIDIIFILYEEMDTFIDLIERYPSSSIQSSLAQAIDNNDRDIIEKVINMEEYLPIEWNYLANHGVRGASRSTIDLIESQMNEQGIERTEKILGNTGSTLYMDILEGCDKKEVLPIYIEISNNPTSDNIYDYLRNLRCISRMIAQFILANPNTQYKAKIYALAAAFIHGWDALLDGYLNNTNIIEAIALALRYGLHSRSWQFLTYMGMKNSGKDYAEWFKYLAGITNIRPIDLDPYLWRQLLSNAILVGNIDLIKYISKMYRDRIGPKFRAWARNIAIREEHNVETILTAMNG